MNDYSCPKIKPFIEFCSYKNKIYFFKGTGSAIEIEDSSKFIAFVCKMMDGNKNIIELKKILSSSYPKETVYLTDLLDILNNAFLLEDTSQQNTFELTEYDLTRWKRNIEFFGAHAKAEENKYLNQKKIKFTKVALLGLGGVGSHILYDLAALGIHNISAIDFDTIELSNLNRQILYNESDIGFSKTDIAKKRILEFLPNAHVNFINKQITSPEDNEYFLYLYFQHQEKKHEKFS